MELAFLIFGMALVTFAARYMILPLLAHGEPHPLFERVLHYVPVAVFAALVTPDLFARGDGISFELATPRFIAGIAAVIIAATTRKILLTIFAGLTIMWLAQNVIGK
ncbi:MAG: AzlD domain-containing protein [Chloroflexi bacterium]|nr:AzlD domain-containing protein [Chloroflexota bacterium]